MHKALMHFCIQETDDVSELIQLMCTQSRTPDATFEKVMLYLCAVLWAYPKKIIDAYWTNMVQFIIVG